MFAFRPCAFLGHAFIHLGLALLLQFMLVGIVCFPVQLFVLDHLIEDVLHLGGVVLGQAHLVNDDVVAPESTGS